MTKDELKLAFQKAFQMGQDYWYHANHEFESYNKKSDAIKEKFNEMVKETIEEALAQPEQEPVARVIDNGTPEGATEWIPFTNRVEPLKTGDLLYTTPPQRPWVGLTNNELQPIADEYRILFGSWVEDFARAIEAKLKEKNT